MPRALETLDHLVAQIERDQLATIEAIEMLLAEELTIRETRRIKAALQKRYRVGSRFLHVWQLQERTLADRMPARSGIDLDQLVEPV
jgi:hypothetical protein